MNEVFQYFIFTILITVGLGAYFLVVSVFFRQRISKIKTNINLKAGRSFLLGFVNLLFFGVIAFLLVAVSERAQQNVKVILLIPALLITVLLAILLSLGLTAIVQKTGSELLPQKSELNQAISGSIMLCFASALPFVGWFLLLPYIGFTSLGATIFTFYQKENPS